jgi:hypothetical protein
LLEVFCWVCFPRIRKDEDGNQGELRGMGARGVPAGEEEIPKDSERRGKEEEEEAPKESDRRGKRRRKKRDPQGFGQTRKKKKEAIR